TTLRRTRSRGLSRSSWRSNRTPSFWNTSATRTTSISIWCTTSENEDGRTNEDAETRHHGGTEDTEDALSKDGPPCSSVPPWWRVSLWPPRPLRPRTDASDSARSERRQGRPPDRQQSHGRRRPQDDRVLWRGVVFADRADVRAERRLAEVRGHRL